MSNVSLRFTLQVMDHQVPYICDLEEAVRIIRSADVHDVALLRDRAVFLVAEHGSYLLGEPV